MSGLQIFPFFFLSLSIFPYLFILLSIFSPLCADAHTGHPPMLHGGVVSGAAKDGLEHLGGCMELLLHRRRPPLAEIDRGCPESSEIDSATELLARGQKSGKATKDGPKHLGGRVELLLHQLGPPLAQITHSQPESSELDSAPSCSCRGRGKG
jgi:hypothetical protein